MNETVLELVERLLNIENELKLLREDKKALFDEYKEKLDIRAVKAAVQIAKIKSKLGDSESEVERILGDVESKITLGG